LDTVHDDPDGKREEPLAREHVDTEVTIVGAGLSGLAAGHRLRREGIEDFVILEATDRVGGRLLNEPVCAGDEPVVEVGGQWCGPNHTALLELAEDVGVLPFPFHSDGSALLETPEGLIPYTGSTLPLEGASGEAMEAVVKRLDELARTTPPDAPWEAPNAAELDRMTVAAWLDSTAADPIARAVLDLRMTLSFTMPTERISMLHVAAFFAGVGGWDEYSKRLKYRLRGGAGLLPRAVARGLGDRVRLKRPARQIHEDPDSVSVISDDVTVTSGRVILALSPGECRPISFTPQLPTGRRLLNEGWQNGGALKAHAVYETPFWRARALSGTTLSVTRFPCMTFDNSPPAGEPGVLGFLFTYGGGPLSVDANELLVADQEDRRQVILHAVAERLGDEALTPQRYFETSWLSQPYTAGCVNPAAPGVLTAAGAALRAPHGRVHWAGTETAAHWTGWMEGAVQAGQRAAGEVLEAGRLHPVASN
jgi:monoamine oxidase